MIKKKNIKRNFTLKNLHRIITRPNIKDGFKIHLKSCWENNDAKSIFYLTGLDVSNLLKEEII